jgi:hypothetical protein
VTAADELLQDSPAARPCHHPRANHQHGTLQRYKQDRCRCAPCSAASLNYDRNRREQMSYGRWASYVDAEPVRTYVYDLLWSKDLQAIAKEAGIARDTVRRLMYGVPWKGQPPARRILARTANALTSVKGSRRSAPENPDLWTAQRSEVPR